MCTHKFFYLFKVIDVNYIYHGDHLTVYTHIESLGCTPETNVSYTLKKKKKTHGKKRYCNSKHKPGCPGNMITLVNED